MNHHHNQVQTGIFRVYQVQLHLITSGYQFISCTHSYDATNELFYGKLEGTLNNVRTYVAFRWTAPSPPHNQTAINELCQRLDKQVAHHDDRSEDYDK